jgi:hypothetical protein
MLRKTPKTNGKIGESYQHTNIFMSPLKNPGEKKSGNIHNHVLILSH